MSDIRQWNKLDHSAVIKMANDRVSTDKIAERLGANRKSVQNCITKYTKSGVIVREVRPARKFDEVGDFLDEFMGLPGEVQAWVDQQAAGEVSWAQFAIACIKDAYVEEKRIKFAPKRMEGKHV